MKWGANKVWKDDWEMQGNGCSSQRVCRLWLYRARLIRNLHVSLPAFLARLSARLH